MSRLDAEPCPVTYGHLAHDWRSPTRWARCPGIKIAAEARYQPQRTRLHVVAELRSIVGALRLKVTRWNASGVDYDGTRLVPRAVEDFPENSSDAWAALARSASDAARDLERLSSYASQRRREVAERERTIAARLKVHQ